MIEIKTEGIILEKTAREFESQAVFNPACVEKDGITHMYYRALRPGNYSTIGYCRLRGREILKRSPDPLLYPEYPYEAKGIEDPRIVLLDGVYYLTYTAFDGRNARIAYATSTDLVHFKKHGIISPEILYDEAIEIFRQSGLQETEAYRTCKLYCEAIGGPRILLWDKDASFFPKKINGHYAMIHRILPDIQIAYFDDFQELDEKFWRRYLRDLKNYIVLKPKNAFELRSIGAGCPPLETKYGWLFIYHGVQDTADGVMYHAAAALLDRDDPRRVLGRLSYPLFSPREIWEKTGNVNNVVFPTSAIVRDGRINIYYGAADKLIALKSLDQEELLEALRHSI